MKKMALMLSAAIFMLSSVPAYSEMTKAEKDECLLASKNCTAQVDDIYKRMHKLNKEIKKGTKVYTPAELQKLKDKLQETDQLLKDMELGGGN
jgi:predicted transcriptional regulator